MVIHRISGWPSGSFFLGAGLRAGSLSYLPLCVTKCHGRNDCMLGNVVPLGN